VSYLEGSISAVIAGGFLCLALWFAGCPGLIAVGTGLIFVGTLFPQRGKP